MGKGHTRGLIATRKRLIGAFMVVVLHEGYIDLSDLLFRVGTVDEQTFLLERAMVPFDKGIEIGPLWGTDLWVDAQTEQKAQESRGKIAPTGASHPAGIAIQ